MDTLDISVLVLVGVFVLWLVLGDIASIFGMIFGTMKRDRK